MSSGMKPTVFNGPLIWPNPPRRIQTKGDDFHIGVTPAKHISAFSRSDVVKRILHVKSLAVGAAKAQNVDALLPKDLQRDYG